MIGTVVCILVCAGGHVFRDGTPATGSTQLARFVGGFICFLGALAVQPPAVAAAFGAAIWLGFYTDQKHGDGQGADNLKSMGYLALSGVTSLVPLALAAGWLLGWRHLGIPVAGLLKPPIWFFAWLAAPSWVPTRIAAAVFGALVGALVAAV